MGNILLLLIISAFAGAYGVVIGAGGGFILVPLLLIIFAISPTVAAGTGLVIVLVNSFIGVLGLARQKRIKFNLGITLSIGAAPGTFIGLWLNTISSPEVFYSIFAAVIFIFGIFLLLKKEPNSNNASENFIATNHTKSKLNILILMVGLLLGIVSGFFGIGGGWLLVPILVYIFKIPIYYATATSLFSLCIYSAIGLIPHLYLGNIDWSIAIYGSAGVIIGAQFGVYLSSKISGSIVVKMLAFILILMGIQLFITNL